MSATLIRAELEVNPRGTGVGLVELEVFHDGNPLEVGVYGVTQLAGTDAVDDLDAVDFLEQRLVDARFDHAQRFFDPHAVQIARQRSGRPARLARGYRRARFHAGKR